MGKNVVSVIHAKRVVVTTHIDAADQSTCKYKREDNRVSAFETQHKDP